MDTLGGGWATGEVLGFAEKGSQRDGFYEIRPDLWADFVHSIRIRPSRDFLDYLSRPTPLFFLVINKEKNY